MAHTVLLTTVYGSHLYGTSTPASDRDFKQIHMNSTDVILIGKEIKCFNRNSNANGKNTSEDIDFESKELKHFIKEALSGQTYAIDLLHTPRELMITTSPLWEEILANKDKLITRNIAPFMGYVESQAAKYSQKGDKINELRNVIKQLEAIPSRMKFKEVAEIINLTGLKHFSIKPYLHKEIKHIDSSKTVSVENYFYGPDCSFPETRKIDEILPILKTKLTGYGDRANLAAINNGLDLKAYYHALRIVWQLEEYLTTAKITFPSARVQDLRDIRAGKYGQSYIEDWIGAEIARVKEIPNNLPTPDYEFWNEWLAEKYMLQAHFQSKEYLESRGIAIPNSFVVETIVNEENRHLLK